MIIATLILIVVGMAMMVVGTVGRSEIAGNGLLPENGFLAAGLEHELIAGSDVVSNAAQFWNEMGMFATSHPQEEGLAYYPLQKTDPRLIAVQARFVDLYGPMYASAQQPIQGRRLALAGPVRGAHESTSVGTLPVGLDAGFIDNTPETVILTPLIKTVPIRTQFVDWNIVDSSPEAEFVTVEGNLPASADDTHNGERIEVSVLATRVEMTGMAQAATQGFVDLSQSKIARRIEAMIQKTEREVINGTGAAGGWNGLLGLTTTNTFSNGGGAITSDDVDDLIELINVSKGHPTIGLAPHNTINVLRKELKDKQELGNQDPQAIGGFELGGNRNMLRYNGIQFFGSNFVAQGAGVKDLFLVDLPRLQFRELRPTMLEKLAKTRDADDWALTRYVTLQDTSANDTATDPGDGTGGQFHGRISLIA